MDACPVCGARPGQLHARGCDVEWCPHCGRQVTFCSCEALECCRVPDDDRLPWTGQHPGDARGCDVGWFWFPR